MTKRKLKIPKEAIKYILFQRTQYLKFPHLRAYGVIRRYAPFFTYNRAVSLEAQLCKGRVTNLYSEEMYDEFLSIRGFLPERCTRILDIGCGVAGLDIFLYQHYDNPDLTLYLLDKSEVDPNVYYSFNEQSAFYNSLGVAESLLILNGVPPNGIRLLEATEANDIDIRGPVDMVVSLISWGFHYPVETYVDRVHALLGEGGCLILDVRKETNGIHVIESMFSDICHVTERERFVRICARK